MTEELESSHSQKLEGLKAMDNYLMKTYAKKMQEEEEKTKLLMKKASSRKS